MKKNQILVAGLLAMAAVLTSFTKDGHLRPGRAIPPVVAANLTMYWIDTEGGAATLIVTPAGESVLIDSGNPGSRDADRIYQVAHNVANLSRIDHVITTHWHKDHYGGAAELAARMPIAEVIDKGVPASLLEDKDFTQNIQAYQQMAVGKRTLIKPSGLVQLQKLAKGLPPLTIRFVGVDKQFVAVTQKAKATDGCTSSTVKATDASDNANSMVLVMDYGPFRFFDGGDLTWNVEKSLVCPNNLVGSVDVYQVNHHGLDQSNNPVLIKNLAPTVSIMNNGPHKGCGPETVTTLRHTPSIAAAYQLHKNVRPDSAFNTTDAYIANRKEKCAANFIKLTVAPDGKKYMVSIPATRHQQTFSTKTVH